VRSATCCSKELAGWLFSSRAVPSRIERDLMKPSMSEPTYPRAALDAQDCSPSSAGHRCMVLRQIDDGSRDLQLQTRGDANTAVRRRAAVAASVMSK